MRQTSLHDFYSPHAPQRDKTTFIQYDAHFDEPFLPRTNIIGTALLRSLSSAAPSFTRISNSPSHDVKLYANAECAIKQDANYLSFFATSVTVLGMTLNYTAKTKFPQLTGYSYNVTFSQMRLSQTYCQTTRLFANTPQRWHQIIFEINAHPLRSVTHDANKYSTSHPALQF